MVLHFVNITINLVTANMTFLNSHTQKSYAPRWKPSVANFHKIIMERFSFVLHYEVNIYCQKQF